MLLKAYPNILGDKKDEPVLTKPDGNSFFTIDPRVHKVENIYFMESTISLEDNIWDLLKLDEKEVSF